MECTEGCESFTINPKVTQKCIDYGLPGKKSFCPVALACSNELPVNSMVYIGYGSIVVYCPWKGEKCTRYEGVIPDECKRFILGFDNNAKVGELPSFMLSPDKFPVEPFEFEVTLSKRGNEF